MAWWNRGARGSGAIASSSEDGEEFDDVDMPQAGAIPVSRVVGITPGAAALLTACTAAGITSAEQFTAFHATATQTATDLKAVRTEYVEHLRADAKSAAIMAEQPAPILAMIDSCEDTGQLKAFTAAWNDKTKAANGITETEGAKRISLAPDPTRVIGVIGGGGASSAATLSAEDAAALDADAAAMVDRAFGTRNGKGGR